MTGKVYLVGAGPGSADLLTVRAMNVLKEADAILYDALVGEEVKALFPPGAELIDVGKRADNHAYPQAEINRMLVDLAHQYRTVVRVKGGDPYVFGRGGEEAETLARRGITVEVVPGISSAIAAPASAGIPVTFRGYASSVTIITGHEDPTKGATALDFRALASLQGTLVILMGIKRLEDNVRALLDNGKAPDTPVAIVESGTTRDERVTVGTLGTIVGLAKQRGVEAPAVIVVGDVVRLREVLGRK
ncbi:MAG: Uroporphyrinogen-III C-methyltransferase [Methanocella sp. PtaU1.Bin125]|nr:MAG: Uroporphyrinogen-III C-methyltransferase [Methanocella sp. PtaU1.Bin125]